MTAPRATDPRSGTESAGPDRFLRACRRLPVDATPVWMMRQAGRCLPAYRELRSRYGFLELVQQPELMAEVSLMPVETLGVDAAILFADIMLPLASLGVDFEIVESVGPVVADPVTTRAQVDAMTRVPIVESVPAVLDCIRIVRAELDGTVPVIGFSGAPFTLACYLVEGRADRSREFASVKELMTREPVTWHALMERLTEMVVEYLREQVAAGVQAVQLFDSWVGALGYADFERFVLPYTARIFASLEALRVPRIAFGTNTAGLLELIAGTDCDVVSVDWRIPLDVAWQRVGYHKAIQGNLEPAVLLRTRDVVEERVRDVVRRAAGRPGHVFNLGHGVLPGTDVDTLRFVVDLVHGAAS